MAAHHQLGKELTVASYAKDPRCTAMNDRMRAALHKVWGEQGPAPVQRGSVALMTQEFRAAVAAGSA